MSITSYSELNTAVTRWTKRTDLTDMVPDWIRLGELRIYREMRLRCMEQSFEGTIASGVVALPDRYIALKNAYIDQTPVAALTRKDAEWIYANYPTRAASGLPKFIAREAENFIFGPYPDSAYTVKGIYYQSLAALSDSNTSNWLMENAPDLLLFAALCEAEPYVENDGRVALWEQKYATLRDVLQRQDTTEEFSGSPLAMTAR